MAKFWHSEAWAREAGWGMPLLARHAQRGLEAAYARGDAARRRARSGKRRRQ